MTVINQIFSALIFGMVGYLSGSLPFSIWVTRIIKKVDVRDAGSGHATTTNTLRQAGFLPGLLVFILDISKGFLPTWLAMRYASAEWIVPLTASLAVAGHCWPIFAKFRGGMGLATTAGGLLAVEPISFVIGLGILISLSLGLKHSARAAVITGLLIAPTFWLVGFPSQTVCVALACGLVIAYRFLIDWNREYRELWLDREKE
ncbi:glycerol-3-phosphate acyltransferase [Chloroflexota bacterium]